MLAMLCLLEVMLRLSAEALRAAFTSAEAAISASSGGPRSCDSTAAALTRSTYLCQVRAALVPPCKPSCKLRIWLLSVMACVKETVG